MKTFSWLFLAMPIAFSGCGPNDNVGRALDVELLENEASVQFDGGHETDPIDHGRPVGLIGPALGVTPEVFREAFSGVTPSKFGPPSPSHARDNKKILMDALSPHGVTNDRLDEVSNYYRYNRAAGEVWKQRPAVATATIEDGKVVGFSIVDGGAGYTKPPTVSVPGHADVRVTAKIEFGTDLETNGQVTELRIVASGGS